MSWENTNWWDKHTHILYGGPLHYLAHLVRFPGNCTYMVKSNFFFHSYSVPRTCFLQMWKAYVDGCHIWMLTSRASRLRRSHSSRSGKFSVGWTLSSSFQFYQKQNLEAIFRAKPNPKQHPPELAKQHFIWKSPAEFRRQFRVSNWRVKWIYWESARGMSQRLWKNLHFRISWVRAPNYKPTYTLVHGWEKSVHPDIGCVHNFKKNKYHFGNCSGSFCQKEHPFWAHSH